MTTRIRIHPEVETALRSGAAVVALESAVITHGLPREPLPTSSRLRAGVGSIPALTDWDWNGPVNLELGRALQRTVRSQGAIPATVAIIAGELCIGLHEDELVALAEDACAAKASVTNLAALISSGSDVYAGSTVSATLAACTLPQSKNQNLKFKINCFATGGIGGVHRKWQQLPDISADLRQLAVTPVCVVSSGAKSILDVPATLETLETLGVPVVGYRTDHFPLFLSPGHESLSLSHRADHAQQVARMCNAHWQELRQPTGILLANPVPDAFAIDAQELEAAIEHAERSASQKQVVGGRRTPFVLAELARLTDGRTLDANIALLLNNASLAAQVATALAASSQQIA